MITKFDEFRATPRGTNITRPVVGPDPEGLQAGALARIVRLAGKLKLTNHDETVKSVFDKMLVRSLAWLAADDIITAELKKYDKILAAFGDSFNNPTEPVYNLNGKLNKNANESAADALFNVPEYTVTLDENASPLDALGAVLRSGYAFTGIYSDGVYLATGKGTKNVSGAAVHRAFVPHRVLEAKEAELTLADIQALPEFQEVLDQGYTLSSSAKQVGRLTLQFGDKAGHKYIVYQNGAVRSLTATNAATNMKRYDALDSAADWAAPLKYVANLLRKKTAKAAKGASKKDEPAKESPKAKKAPVAHQPLVMPAPASKPLFPPGVVLNPVVPSVVPPAVAAKGLSAEDIFDELKYELKGLKKYGNSGDLELRKSPDLVRASWQDHNDVYDWKVSDDDLHDPDHRDSDFEDWDYQEPYGAAYTQDVNTVAAAAKKYPKFDISLQYDEKFWVTLYIQRK